MTLERTEGDRKHRTLCLLIKILVVEIRLNRVEKNRKKRRTRLNFGALYAKKRDTRKQIADFTKAENNLPN